MSESEYNVMIEGDMAVEVLVPEIEIVKLANGFGFGEGAISYASRKEEVGPETLQSVEAAITSKDILVPVSKDSDGNRIDDDGCGDGRSVKHVFEGTVIKAKSLNRSKVFGGGVAMTAGIKIGLGDATGTELQQLFHESIEDLKDKKVDFGAHTDDHNGPESINSGCGAIDRAPVAIANAVKFRSQIEESIAALGADLSGLDEVYANFEQYAGEIADQDYSGKKVTNEITDNGKIVKELQHQHYEMFVVLNTVEGYTINQELIRSVSGGKVQVFGVDVWRMQELAMREYPNDPEKQNKAFLSELVYTLGVSATLTPGDQPVFVVNQKQN